MEAMGPGRVTRIDGACKDQEPHLGLRVQYSLGEYGRMRLSAALISL
jgi:hypothetical protein